MNLVRSCALARKRNYEPLKTSLTHYKIAVKSIEKRCNGSTIFATPNSLNQASHL
jgi:hypothetical protein